MRPARWGVLAVALLAFSSCVIWIDPDDSDFDSRAVRAAAEVNRHHALLTDAADLVAARAEIDRHAAEMAVRLEALRGDMDDDWRCAWGGMDRMRDLMEGTDRLLGDYLAEAAGAADLAALDAACHAYAAAMNDALIRLMDRWDEMRCE